MLASSWSSTSKRRERIVDDPRPIAPSHGENRGPLGSANKIKYSMQASQLVSNNCPINVYGQAWTACRFLDWTTCAVRVALPPLAPPCGWRSPNDLDVAENAAASAGSYEQRIEGNRWANRYPTLEMPTQYIFGTFLTAT